MSISGTIQTSGSFAPTSTDDSFGTHNDKWGVGGYRSVISIGERNSLPVNESNLLNLDDELASGRRKLGMLVHVVNGNTYKLVVSNWDSLNEYEKVSALADNANWVEQSSGGGGLPHVKSGIWGYPDLNSARISNEIDGSSIALHSNLAALLRWHVRAGGRSLSGYSISILSFVSVTGTGPFFVTFNIDEQEYLLPTERLYSVNSSSVPSFDGQYPCSDSTLNTITLQYDTDPTGGDPVPELTATIIPPSIYNQVEAREDGIWLKMANWTDPSGYSKNWHFKTDGNAEFPGEVQFQSGGSVGQGTFDTGRGGNKGVSLFCAIGYEWNWQANYLRVFQKDGDGTALPINTDSEIILSDVAPSVPSTGRALTTKTYVDSLVTTLLDLRGSWSPASELFPSDLDEVGSGEGGVILKGDFFFAATSGIIQGRLVNSGTGFFAIVDSPGQDIANWNFLETGLGFIPENSANKTSNINNTDSQSYPDTPTVKAAIDAVFLDKVVKVNNATTKNIEYLGDVVVGLTNVSTGDPIIADSTFSFLGDFTGLFSVVGSNQLVYLFDNTDAIIAYGQYVSCSFDGDNTYLVLTNIVLIKVASALADVVKVVGYTFTVDSLLTLREADKRYLKEPFEFGNNYIIVKAVSNDDSINGANLQLALGLMRAKKVAWDSSLYPADTYNRLTVFLTPGRYNIKNSTLSIDTNYIDIIGTSSNPEDTYLFSDSLPSDSLIYWTNNSTSKIENLSIKPDSANSGYILRVDTFSGYAGNIVTFSNCKLLGDKIDNSDISANSGLSQCTLVFTDVEIVDFVPYFMLTDESSGLGRRDLYFKRVKMAGFTYAFQFTGCVMQLEDCRIEDGSGVLFQTFVDGGCNGYLKNVYIGTCTSAFSFGNAGGGDSSSTTFKIYNSIIRGSMTCFGGRMYDTKVDVRHLPGTYALYNLARNAQLHRCTLLTEAGQKSVLGLTIPPFWIAPSGSVYYCLTNDIFSTNYGFINDPTYNIQDGDLVND